MTPGDRSAGGTRGRAEDVARELRALADPAVRASQARFGIETSHSLGLRVPQIRSVARSLGTDHALALQLWRTGIHEARLLAPMIDDPALVTPAQMERRAKDFASWDVVDGCCSSLFERTPHAVDKAIEWSARPDEFVKRAGFAIMAYLAARRTSHPDALFRSFLALAEQQAWDDRNFVKKAINWPVREIGKRNIALNRAAIRSAERVRAQGTRSARWIAADALRELQGEAVQARLR